MSEHTPGPWIYDGVVQIVESERPHMRICFLPSDHYEYASSKPNARLIAAAPDMLAALKALRDAVCDRQRKHDCPGFDCSVCTPSAELNAADAAIAKAESKS